MGQPIRKWRKIFCDDWIRYSRHYALRKTEKVWRQAENQIVVPVSQFFWGLPYCVPTVKCTQLPSSSSLCIYFTLFSILVGNFLYVRVLEMEGKGKQVLKNHTFNLIVFAPRTVWTRFFLNSPKAAVTTVRIETILNGSIRQTRSSYSMEFYKHLSILTTSIRECI